MTRQTLQQQLSQHEPIDKQESDSLMKMRMLVTSSDDIFSRTYYTPGHFTASSWIVSPDGEKALLTHHKKLNRWLQLGGHADGDADLINVCLRESLEESGLANLHLVLAQTFDVDVHTIPACGVEPEHNHYDVRYLLQSPTWNVTISNESKDLQWFTPQEIMKLTDNHSIKRMVQKWDFVLGDE